MVDAGDARTTTDISTAAQLLGLSIEALRKRLQRGRMEGFKAPDGSWRVVLDGVDGQGGTYPGDLAGALAGGMATARSDGADSAALLREIRHLDMQVQTLTGEVRSLEEAVRSAGLMVRVAEGGDSSGNGAGRADPDHDAGLHAVKEVLLEVLTFLQRKSG